MPRVSVCSPVHNEETNLHRLVAQMQAAMSPVFGTDWEQVLVDDGSTDSSAAIIRELAADHHALRLISHHRNMGEWAAWQTAFDNASGRIVVLLAADLQNDPGDIPSMVEALSDEAEDCCTGFRTDRKDGLYYWLATRVLNGFMRVAFGVDVRDVTSSFFAVRRRYVENLRLVKNDHRYILAIFRRRGAQIVEVPTTHQPRVSGSSHYSRWKVLWAVPEVLAFGRRFFAGFYDDGRPGSTADERET